ncbi:MAG: diacylglycerol kinase family protein [Fluviicola sp.]|nr:diacylglycerol kinase family protein [Fluviicola sp.]
MKKVNFSIAKRIKSFGFAFNGLRILFHEEHNSRIHFFASVLVVIAALLFKLNTYEWFAIIFSIGLVVTAEIINTAVENIADFLTTEQNNHIKKIKDLAAAAVLVSALTALTIGLIIFLPKITTWANL